MGSAGAAAGDEVGLAAAAAGSEGATGAAGARPYLCWRKGWTLRVVDGQPSR